MYPVLPNLFLHKSFQPPLCRKGMVLLGLRKAPHRLQHSPELPQTLQCFINSEKWEMGRGEEKSKDSAGSHPTHLDSLQPQWIIQSRVIFIVCLQWKVCCSQRLLTVIQRSLCVVCRCGWWQCLVYASEYLGLDYKWPEVSRWCYEIFNSSQSQGRLF